MNDWRGQPTLGATIADARARLVAAGCETAGLDARLLAAHIFGSDIATMIGHPERMVGRGGGSPVRSRAAAAPPSGTAGLHPRRAGILELVLARKSGHVDSPPGHGNAGRGGAGVARSRSHGRHGAHSRSRDGQWLPVAGVACRAAGGARRRRRHFAAGAGCRARKRRAPRGWRRGQASSAPIGRARYRGTSTLSSAIPPMSAMPSGMNWPPTFAISSRRWRFAGARTGCRPTEKSLRNCRD